MKMIEAKQIAKQCQANRKTENQGGITETNIWMDEAREIAERCWDDFEVVASTIAAWMEVAAQNQRNTDYYRSLVERCGKAIGERAYITDRGGHSEDVLCAKVPEIVEADYVGNTTT